MTIQSSFIFKSLLLTFALTACNGTSVNERTGSLGSLDLKHKQGKGDSKGKGGDAEARHCMKLDGDSDMDDQDGDKDDEKSSDDQQASEEKKARHHKDCVADNAVPSSGSEVKPAGGSSGQPTTSSSGQTAPSSTTPPAPTTTTTPPATTTSTAVTYAMVKPIWDASCNGSGCHSSPGAAGISLDSYSGAKSGYSSSISAINGGRMPLGRSISSADIQKLKDWAAGNFAQ